jgi:hypothetical protein
MIHRHVAGLDFARYLCTYSLCPFSSDDRESWRRHEEVRHSQTDAWRCSEECSTSKIKQCAKLFHNKVEFKEHLSGAHGIADGATLGERCRTQHLGRHNQGNFWCGFCLKMIKLNERSLAAWAERHKHLSEHFEKDEKAWMSLYPVTEDEPKWAAMLREGQKGGEESVDELP